MSSKKLTEQFPDLNYLPEVELQRLNAALEGLRALRARRDTTLDVLRKVVGPDVSRYEADFAQNTVGERGVHDAAIHRFLRLAGENGVAPAKALAAIERLGGQADLMLSAGARDYLQGVVEAKALAQYKELLGKVVRVRHVSVMDAVEGWTQREAQGGVLVRIEETARELVARWNDDHCDPYYEARIVGNHPELQDLDLVDVDGQSISLLGLMGETTIVEVLDEERARVLLQGNAVADEVNAAPRAQPVAQPASDSAVAQALVEVLSRQLRHGDMNLHDLAERIVRWGRMSAAEFDAEMAEQVRQELKRSTLQEAGFVFAQTLQGSHWYAPKTNTEVGEARETGSGPLIYGGEQEEPDLAVEAAWRHAVLDAVGGDLQAALAMQEQGLDEQVRCVRRAFVRAVEIDAQEGHDGQEDEDIERPTDLRQHF